MAMVVLISLVLLSLGFSGADEECVYAAVGKTKVIYHDYPGLELLEPSFHLRWTHDSKIVYDNKKGTEKKYQTTKNGSLLLETLQLDNTGSYQATIYDNLGKLMKSTVTRLCVLVPVSKPRLIHICNGTSVTLKCDVRNPEVVNLVWQRNGNTLPGQTDSTLTITKATLKPEDRYACTASIKASEEKSDDVSIECTVLLFGMELWRMVLILAGGGGLLLILSTVVCVCSSRRQRKRRLEEEEMRLAPLTQPTCQASLHH